MMKLATAVTYWEWSKNIYWDPKTRMFVAGGAMTDQDPARFRVSGMEADAHQSHASLSWTGNYHTHTADLNGAYYLPSTPRTAPDGVGDTTIGNHEHINMYVGSPPNYLYVHNPAPGDHTSHPITP
jgi:hypothetical protein